MAPVICNYEFPCHPADMFRNSPDDMTDDARTLRTHFIRYIAELSKKFSQNTLDQILLIDIDAQGQIIGMDMSGLYSQESDTMCVGQRCISLGDMTAEHWTTMKVSKN